LNSSPIRSATVFAQVCFLFIKTKVQDHHGFKTLQDFLDHSEYAEKSIRKYESVRGEGYVTIGGAELSRTLTKRLNLQPAHRLLNVGSATGGSSFQIAEVKRMRFAIDAHSDRFRIINAKSLVSIFQRT
jgi:hypothetical protein